MPTTPMYRMLCRKKVVMAYFKAKIPMNFLTTLKMEAAMILQPAGNSLPVYIT
jgi:hypothetical protein